MGGGRNSKCKGHMAGQNQWWHQDPNPMLPNSQVPAAVGKSNPKGSPYVLRPQPGRGFLVLRKKEFTIKFSRPKQKLNKTGHTQEGHAGGDSTAGSYSWTPQWVVLELEVKQGWNSHQDRWVFLEQGGDFQEIG